MATIPNPPEHAPEAEIDNLRSNEEEGNDVESVGVCASDMDSSVNETTTRGGGGSRSGNSMEESSEDARKKEQEQLAKEETLQINRLRWWGFKVLLLAALIISVIVYMISRNAQNDEYEKAYDGAAKLITDAFTDIMTSKMGAVSSMGVALIAHGKDHAREWPFVTLSSFQQRASTALAQSGAIYLHVNPLVSEEDRHEWEHDFVIGEDADWM